MSDTERNPKPWYTTKAVGDTLELPGVTLRVARIHRGRVQFEVLKGAEIMKESVAETKKAG